MCIRDSATAVIKYKNDFFQNLAPTTDLTDSIENNITYRVQIAATNRLIPLKPYNFKGLESIDVVKEGNLYKYLYGEHQTIEDAKSSLEEAIKSGHKGSFIVGFVNNKIKILN